MIVPTAALNIGPATNVIHMLSMIANAIGTAKNATAPDLGVSMKADPLV
jgi:hypothetical protein